MRRLLIVEDDMNTLQGLMELLNDEGYIVYGESTGKDALNAVTTKKIDIVLCDFSLPDIDGLQVCQQLNKLNSGLTLLLATAFYDTNMFDTAKKCGVFKVFHKPLLLDDLLETLSTVSKNFNTTNPNSLSLGV